MRCPKCGHEFLLSESVEDFGDVTPFDEDAEGTEAYDPEKVVEGESEDLEPVGTRRYNVAPVEAVSG